MFELKWSTVSKPEIPEPEKKEQEWIWIEGYKGTDKNMCCRDYKFNLHERFDMPEDAEIALCSSGFHLCRELKHVFPYYDIENEHRFFKVRALVRKDPTKSMVSSKNPFLFYYNTLGSTSDKEVAKSIEFIEEVSTEELFKVWKRENMPYDKKLTLKKFERIRQIGLIGYKKEQKKKEQAAHARKLKQLGYSDGFATFISKYNDGDRYETAVKVAALPISQEMKAAYILLDGVDMD